MRVFDKEKPQATPRERLAAVQDALGELPHQYDVEFVNEGVGAPAVYLNYDFDTAVVIEDVNGNLYALVAMHWDQTHAVDDEHYIGMLTDAQVAAQVAVQFAKDHESL
jgi:hypothetical protein